MKKTENLGRAGAALRRRLHDAAAKAGRLDVLREACKLTDRLSEVRAILKKEGLLNAKGEKHPLLAEEVKLSAQLRLYLKMLDLGERRGPGRPAASEGWDRERERLEALARFKEGKRKQREQLAQA